MCATSFPGRSSKHIRHRYWFSAGMCELLLIIIDAQVDSVLCVGDKVYSGGDKRIMVSDVYSGAVLHQVTRDTGTIPLLDRFENSLICCSASGAIRFFGLSFNVKRIKLVC